MSLRQLTKHNCVKCQELSLHDSLGSLCCRVPFSSPVVHRADPEFREFISRLHNRKWRPRKTAARDRDSGAAGAASGPQGVADLDKQSTKEFVDSPVGVA